MRSSPLPLLVAIAVAAGSAVAAPPGHAPDAGNDMLLPLKAPMPTELPNRGKVLELIQTDSHAFIRVAPDQGGEAQWIAGPLAPMRVGDHIGYSDGGVQKDFFSKTLGRSFASLMFADHVAVLPSGR